MTFAGAVNESDLKLALIKDFNALYVKEFATDWETKRVVRFAEIMVMDFNHLIKVIEAHDMDVWRDSQHG